MHSRFVASVRPDMNECRSRALRIHTSPCSRHKAIFQSSSLFEQARARHSVLDRNECLYPTRFCKLGFCSYDYRSAIQVVDTSPSSWFSHQELYRARNSHDEESRSFVMCTCVLSFLVISECTTFKRCCSRVIFLWYE